MAKRWFGRRGYFTLTPGLPGGTVFQLFASFDSPTFNDGDSLLRVLLGWQMRTALTDFGGVPDRGPWPTFITLDYDPAPDGEIEIGTPPIGGDALWREPVQWNRVHFTDGATDSYGWEASSNQMRSGQAQRTVSDKTTAQLVGTVSLENAGGGDDFPDSAGYVITDISGYLWYEYLVLQ